MPEKYRRLGDFAAYYSGAKRAPILTIFIGGNHEASNYLHELFYGGWVAPNIYYLGCSGAIRYRGLRIAGLSGIYKRHDYRAGFHERLPFTEDSKRSIYHVRAFDVAKLVSLETVGGGGLALGLGGRRTDVFLSHDWPAGVERFGDLDQLLRRKPFFREEIERNDFGSPPGWEILRELRPRYWFSAHLHVKFAAIVDHDGIDMAEEEGEIDLDVDEGEINLDDDGEGEIKWDEREGEIKLGEDKGMSPGKRPLSPSASNSEAKRQRQEHEMTRFLALDKCLPRRDFLQILDLDEDLPITDAPLSYDPHWLAITKTFHPYLSMTRIQPPLPPKQDLHQYPCPQPHFSPVLKSSRLLVRRIEENLVWVHDHIQDFAIPDNFKVVAPVHDSNDPPQSRKQRTLSLWLMMVDGFLAPFYTNPQTVEFCKMLEIDESKMPR
jgi:lariat debranching enzyme